MIIEAPDTNGRTLDRDGAGDALPAHYGLRARKAMHRLFVGDRAGNRLSLRPRRADRPGTIPRARPSASAAAARRPRFDSTFRYDLDTDSAPELIRFSKPPLELAVKRPAGMTLRLIGVHAKSKAPHGADRARGGASALSIENRRKQLAQCLWIRAAGRRTSGARRSLIVMGDFNDGPGLDEFEKLFGQSGVEIVLGTATRRPRCGCSIRMPRWRCKRRVGLAPTTARFYLAPQEALFRGAAGFHHGLARSGSASAGLADLAPVQRPRRDGRAGSARGAVAGVRPFSGDAGSAVARHGAAIVICKMRRQRPYWGLTRRSERSRP